MSVDSFQDLSELPKGENNDLYLIHQMWRNRKLLHINPTINCFGKKIVSHTDFDAIVKIPSFDTRRHSCKIIRWLKIWWRRNGDQWCQVDIFLSFFHYFLPFLSRLCLTFGLQSKEKQLCHFLYPSLLKGEKLVKENMCDFYFPLKQPLFWKDIIVKTIKMELRNIVPFVKTIGKQGVSLFTKFSH